MRYTDPVVSREQGDDAWRVEILHEGSSISRLWIVDRHLRVGRATLHTAGIAGVGTDHQHRQRGLALRVLHRSIEFMQEQGYDASFLFGIQDFYHRVDFATCFPEHDLSLDTRRAESATSSLRVRPLQAEDIAAVRRLFNHENATRTGTTLRGRAWQGFPMGSGFDRKAAAYVVHAPRARGKVLGYVVVDDTQERCRAAEVGGTGDEVFGAILGFLGQHAVDLRREQITLSLPGDHPFALYARRYGCQDQTRYPRNAGPMGRSLDLVRFCAAMAPEWRSLWPDDAPARLVLRVGTEAVTLRRRADDLAVSATAKGAGLTVAGAGALMQLAMGYRTADDALAEGVLSATGARADLARALFPLRVGHMWWPDRF